MRSLGLRGAQIGSHVNGRNLDDPALDPVWAAADALRAFVLVHPHGEILPGDRLKPYYMRNFVGLPFETTMAGAALVFGGVIERHPGVAFCLCHGGGFVPYQAGRFVHAFNVRAEPKSRLRGSPEASLARLHYDTIVHSPRALEFLIETAGADHVLLGSDYPFDMGNLDCVARVEALALRPEIRATVLGNRARELLGDGAADLDTVRAERLRRTLAAVAAAHPFYRARFRGAEHRGRRYSLARRSRGFAAHPQGGLHRRSGGVSPAAGRSSRRTSPRKSACCGTSPTPPEPPAAGRRRSTTPRMTPTRSGIRRAAATRPRASPPPTASPTSIRWRVFRPAHSSASSAPAMVVGLPGRARPHRRGQFRVQGAQFAGRGGRRRSRAFGRPCCGACRASSAASSTRRSGAAPISRTCGSFSPRASRCRRRCGSSCARRLRGSGPLSVADPRALCLHRDAGRPGAVRRGRAAAEPLPRPLPSRGGRSGDRPQARRTARAACSRSPICTVAAPCCCATWSATSSRWRGRRARSAGARESGSWRRRGAPAAWSNAAACWSTPMSSLIRSRRWRASAQFQIVFAPRGRPGAMERLVIRIEQRHRRGLTSCAKTVTRRVREAVSLRPEVEFVARGALYDHERSIKAKRVLDLRTRAD